MYGRLERSKRSVVVVQKHTQVVIEYLIDLTLSNCEMLGYIRNDPYKSQSADCSVKRGLRLSVLPPFFTICFSFDFITLWLNFTT